MNATVETSTEVPKVEQPRLKPRSLAETVCKIFGIPKDRLFKQTKEIAIKNAHKCYMYFISEMLDRGPTITARHMGLSHSTVIIMLKKFNYLYRTEEEYAEKVDEVFRLYYAGLIIMPEVEERSEKRRAA